MRRENAGSADVTPFKDRSTKLVLELGEKVMSDSLSPTNDAMDAKITSSPIRIASDGLVTSIDPNDSTLMAKEHSVLSPQPEMLEPQVHKRSVNKATPLELNESAHLVGLLD